MTRPQIAPDGPQTPAECRQIVAYHEQEVERIERRVDAVGARWESTRKPERSAA